MTDSTAMTSSDGGELPVEMRLEILAQALRFPNGIYTHRWASLRIARVEKWLKIPGFGRFVPEALFKYNQLIIEPLLESDPERSNQGGSTLQRTFRLTYPGKVLAHHVKDLELQISLSRLHEDMSNILIYCSWLQKLANLELGFDQLTMFKISVISGCFSPANQRGIDRLVDTLKIRFGAMKFPCKSFQLEILHHTCGDICMGSHSLQCQNWAEFNQLFSATG
jgi:hypothetical protein